MLKFISSNEEVLTFNNRYEEVKDDVSPFKEIINKEDYSSFSLVIDNKEEEKISLSEIFQLQVNVKKIGTFNFLFLNKDFDKNEIVKKISSLKEVKVDNLQDAKNKVANLLLIAKEHNCLFAIYKEIEHSLYDPFELRDEIAECFPIFVIQSQKEIISELHIGENPLEEENNAPIKKDKATKISKGKFLQLLNKNKYSLLLILVSSLLMQVSIPLAIFNIYSGNMLYIFLFICGAIGVVMDGYCYFDYFKTNNIKNPLFLLNIAVNVIGIGIGIGVFAIFYNISVKVESTPNMGSLIVIGLLVSIIIVVAIAVLMMFIPRKNKDPEDK